MNITTFKETNMVYGANDNPNTDQLPVAICTNPGFPGGRVFVISKWKPTPEELQKINETGEVWLLVMGEGLLPAFVTGHNPFTDHGYIPIKLDQLI